MRHENEEAIAGVGRAVLGRAQWKVIVGEIFIMGLNHTPGITRPVLPAIVSVSDASCLYIGYVCDYAYHSHMRQQ